MSLSARRAWIEIMTLTIAPASNWSLSARRAWIEMPWLLPLWLLCWVALRKESVDRNCKALQKTQCLPWSLSARRAWIEIIVLRLTKFASLVALRKESVDRNLKDSAPALLPAVALRKESVDRNNLGLGVPGHGKGSLSARRAWIEIPARSATIYGPIGRSPQGERG